MENWKTELEDLAKEEQEHKEEEQLIAQAGAVARELNIKKAGEFLHEWVEPAFHELAAELKKYVKRAWWDGGTIERNLHVQHKNGATAIYTIRANVDSRIVTIRKGFSSKDARGRSDYEHGGYFPVKCNGIASPTEKASTERDMSSITKDDIISDFMTEYKEWKRKQL